MAHTTPKVDDIDDYISRYGSIKSGTFKSTHTCSSRRNSINLLAKNLKKYHARHDQDNPDGTKQYDISSIVSRQKRFNKSFHHYRLLVVMLAGISVGLMQLMRYNISISILRMVNQTHMYLEEHPDKTVEDFLEEGYSLGGEFNWNNKIVQIILSWYMVTYTLPQIAAAKLSVKMGCRLSVPISLAICAISELLTPYCAYMGWEYVVALRMINGLGASAVVPTLMNIVEKWMQYGEISYGLTMATAVEAATVTVAPLVAGYLCAIHWSLAFYIPGGFVLVFCALWLILISDSPEQSRFVSAKELLHIYSEGGGGKEEVPPTSEPVISDKNDDDRAGKVEQEKKRVVSRKDKELEYQAESWTQVFSFPSFYAYLMIWILYEIVYNATFILPTYFRQFLKIKVAENGFYNSIIQTGSILAAIWPHPLLKMLQNFGLSITHSRIVAHAICCSIVAASWFYIGIFHEHQLLLLFLFRASHSCNDIIVIGSLMSNYAKAGLSSVAFAIINTVGNLSVVPTSTLIGWALDYTNQSREGWCWIFCGLGVSQLAMFAVFALFVDSNPIKFTKKAPQIDVEFNQKMDPEKDHRDNQSGTERQANSFRETKKNSRTVRATSLWSNLKS